MNLRANRLVPADNRRYTWLILLRGGLVFALLGGWVLTQTGDFPHFPLYLLLGITLVFTAFSLAWISRPHSLKSQTLFLYFQIVWDPFFISALILFTGGSESIFSFLYLFGIVTASIFLHRRGALLIASLSAILYGGFADLEFYQILNLSGVIRANPAREYFFTVGANIAAYFAVAILASSLSEQLRSTEAELEKKKDDLSSLLAVHGKIVESISSGVLTVDASDRILSLNRAGEETLGRKTAEIFNKNLADIFPVLAREIAARDQKKTTRPEVSLPKPDGSLIYLGFSLSALKGEDGEGLGKILIFQDITRVKEMEKEIMRSEKMAAIGELAAGIAHEIRNPLGAISGPLQLLLERQELPEEEIRLMRIILRETERLNRLVTDFLRFARPEKPRFSPLDPVQILDECVEFTSRGKDFPPGIKIEKHYEKPRLIQADPHQLRQLFLNLLINAGEAMPAGGTLRVWSRNGADRGQLEIGLSDTGMGMNEETQARLFEPFFTTKEKGIGLGLAIVHRIVELHGARIQVESRPGAGAVFTLSFPLSGEDHAQ
ncbi:MAG: ATP-binding protein [bacterium]|nr:ATP-binding protein [bacterium]